MSGREITSHALRLALAAIVAHAAVNLLHGAAHQILGVPVSTSQSLFIALVIVVAPLLAGVLLWKGVRTMGAMLLIGSMLGALSFGVYNHFIAISADHVSHVSSATRQNWVLVFQTTAVLLALTEAFGIWAGIRALKRV